MKPVVYLCKDLNGVRHFWDIAVQDWVQEGQGHTPTPYTQKEAETVIGYWAEHWTAQRGAYILVADSAPVEPTGHEELIRAIQKSIRYLQTEVARLEAIADLARELAQGGPVHTEDCSLLSVGRVDRAVQAFLSDSPPPPRECDCKAGETYRTLKTLCG